MVDVGERRPLCFLRAFTTPKRNDTPNEDSWCRSEDGTVVVVSDGASVSFDPATWAQIITRRFVEDYQVGPEWLDAAIGEYRSGHDREVMDWMRQGAFDRGTFASQLGAVILPTGDVRTVVIGDSLLAVIDGKQVVQTIPYQLPHEFDQSPRLISTNAAENRSMEEALPAAWHDISIASLATPILLLMTDALGRWLLDQPDEERVGALLDIRDDEAFEKFVDAERAEKRLVRDDTTVAVVGVAP